MPGNIETSWDLLIMFLNVVFKSFITVLIVKDSDKKIMSGYMLTAKKE